MIQNKANLKSRSGFTIVELLIVIVVIGILAAITIVAYSGITARANATKAQTNAANVQKVAETYNADSANTGYPANVAALTGYAGLARVPSGVSVVAGAVGAVTSANGTTTVQYLPRSTTGGCIGWWDFSVASSNLKFIFVGGATGATETTCT